MLIKGLVSLILKEGILGALIIGGLSTHLCPLQDLCQHDVALAPTPLKVKVISSKQTSFLPLRFILDNILLIQEIFNWFKISNQPVVFFKLDFTKAYDKESWKFYLKLCIG